MKNGNDLNIKDNSRNETNFELKKNQNLYEIKQNKKHTHF